MKILKSSITIISEVIVLILSALWYRQTKEYEPLIGIVVASVGLFSSLLSKIFIRPKLVLHRKKKDMGRNSKGYTANNPAIIKVGIDNPEQYWELDWNYELEIRNNSSETAYNIEIEYLNLPPKIFIDGKIGKTEPLLANEMRVFNIKLMQSIVGTHIDADKYLKANPDILAKYILITLKYEDESGTAFYTNYNWVKDENRSNLIF